MRIAPISIYDVPAQQAWLEDMAAKGHFLSEYKNGIFSLASFTRESPKAVRYRLEPAGGREYPPLEQRQVYRSLGWDHVTTAGREMYVWRCDDPNAPELHTEPETEARAYDRLVRRQRWLRLLVLAIFLLPLALVLGLSIGVEDYYLRSVRSWTASIAAWFIPAAYAFGLWQFTQESLALRRFVRTLRAGVPVPHRRPYRFSQAMAWAAAVMYLCVLGLQVANLFEPRSRPFLPVESFEEPVPVVDFGPGEDLAIRVDNWRTPEQWWLWQTLADGEAVHSSYYRFWTESQARRLVRQYQRLDDYALVDLAGVDEAWYTQTERYQSVFLRSGKQVLELSAQMDLRPYLQDCAALLAEKGAQS